jgi:hypothetical protein
LAKKDNIAESKKSNSFNDMFMDILLKGLKYMSGTIRIAIQNNDSLRIESANKQIKLHIIDPSIFEIPLEMHKETKKDNKITDFFKHIKEAKEFAHKLSENELTVSILNKDENAITLGKDAHPSFSKLITRSDDIQIDSVRKSIKLATDINKDEDVGFDDKIKAGARALAKKIEDPDRDTGEEYEAEKAKERVED